LFEEEQRHHDRGTVRLEDRSVRHPHAVRPGAVLLLKAEQDFSEPPGVVGVTGLIGRFGKRQHRPARPAEPQEGDPVRLEESAGAVLAHRRQRHPGQRPIRHGRVIDQVVGELPAPRQQIDP
jgi:hypothetical protein